MQEIDVFEDDDGLGYYPDGVKRTLTDEQIAMFRHSEIYAIIRQRQLRLENKDVGTKDQAVGSALEGHDLTEVVEQAVDHKGPLNLIEGMLPSASAGGEEVNSDDEEEYVRFLEIEKEEMQTEAARKKRKRDWRDGAQKHERAPTHRRLVRELDEVVVDDGQLDYGEEPAAFKDLNGGSSHTEVLQKSLRRKPMVYDEEGAGSSVEASDPSHAGRTVPEQGRKIWWPTIGT